MLASLRAALGVEEGLSDHSLDPVLVPVLAVLNSACVVEMHFALSREGGGLDDPIAIEPSPFRTMVERIREAEKELSRAALQPDRTAAWRRLEREFGVDRVRAAKGSGVKSLAPAEQANYTRTNRLIHAVSAIRKGARIGSSDIAVLRTEKILRPGARAGVSAPYPRRPGTALSRTR